MIGGQAVDGHQDVVLHCVFLQQPQPAHDLVEGRRAALIDPVGIVQVARPVDADANQEVILFEELTFINVFYPVNDTFSIVPCALDFRSAALPEPSLLHTVPFRKVNFPVVYVEPSGPSISRPSSVSPP